LEEVASARNETLGGVATSVPDKPNVIAELCCMETHRVRCIDGVHRGWAGRLMLEHAKMVSFKPDPWYDSKSSLVRVMKSNTEVSAEIHVSVDRLGQMFTMWARQMQRHRKQRLVTESEFREICARMANWLFHTSMATGTPYDIGNDTDHLIPY
jgi:hypothetical protein